MADDVKSQAKDTSGEPVKAAQSNVAASKPESGEFVVTIDQQEYQKPNLQEVAHYEEIAEYRIGEGPPPFPLIIMFVLIVLWATLSWIPFFGPKSPNAIKR